MKYELTEVLKIVENFNDKIDNENVKFPYTEFSVETNICDFRIILTMENTQIHIFNSATDGVNFDEDTNDYEPLEGLIFRKLQEYQYKFDLTLENIINYGY